MSASLRPNTNSKSKLQGHLKKWLNYVKSYKWRWFVCSAGHLSYYESPSHVGRFCLGSVNLAFCKLGKIDQSLKFILEVEGCTTAFYLLAPTKLEFNTWLTRLTEEIKLARSGLIEANCIVYGDGSDGHIDEKFHGLRDFSRGNELLEEARLMLDIYSKQLVHYLYDKYPPPVSPNSEPKTPAHMADLKDEDLWPEVTLTVKELTDKVASKSQDLCKICVDLAVMAAERFAYVTNTAGMTNCTQRRTEDSRKEEGKTEEDFSGDPSEERRARSLPCDLKSSQDSIGPATLGVTLNVSREVGNDINDNSSNEEYYDARDKTPSPASCELDQVSKFDGSSCDENLGAGLNCWGDNTSDGIHFKSPLHIRSSSDILQMGKSSATTGRKKYRTRIPSRQENKLSAYSFLMNSVGKDLSKITIPVNFNEPISFLQRVSEVLEYWEILDRAAACECPYLQMCYLMAFSVSNYATTAHRTCKPFNPLLGETFEMDRKEDFGWRSICEQVSHHPPICALHAEGRGWVLSETYNVKSKFRGKFLKIEPVGLSQCTFTRTGFHYSWNKATTHVHNVVIGTIWIDQLGTITMKNNTTGDVGTVEFTPFSYLRKVQFRKVAGSVVSNLGDTKYMLFGTWDSLVECTKVHQGPKKDGACVNGKRTILWKCNNLSEYASKMYFFSDFACSLNEMEDGVAPTDSRLRPDQRKLENCEVDLAGEIKSELEEKQRARRKKDMEVAISKGIATSSTSHESIYQPLWFEVDKNTRLKCQSALYRYKGGYWEAKEAGDWSGCVDIFAK